MFYLFSSWIPLKIPSTSVEGKMKITIHDYSLPEVEAGDDVIKEDLRNQTKCSNNDREEILFIFISGSS